EGTPLLTSRYQVAIRRSGAFTLVLGVLFLVLGAVAPGAQAAGTVTFMPGDASVQVNSTNASCNGIIPPKSDTSADKKLNGFANNNTDFPQYTITYPTDPNNVGNFAILDCMLLGTPGQDLKQMTVVGKAEL